MIRQTNGCLTLKFESSYKRVIDSATSVIKKFLNRVLTKV